MKTDAQLKSDVTRELEWDPAVNATNVGVSVKNGVVTLTGHLETYTEKYAVERAAQRVMGVKAVAVEVDVKLSPMHKRSDTEIAEAAESALLWNTAVPDDRIKVKVEKGWITLTGEVDWEYQRRAARAAVQSLIGVVGVSSSITLKPHATPGDVAIRIRQALERQALEDAKRIDVAVTGTKAVLRGKVHSWAERTAVQTAAWSAPGILAVENDLEVAA